jgi:hypothetical protein
MLLRFLRLKEPITEWLETADSATIQDLTIEDEEIAEDLVPLLYRLKIDSCSSLAWGVYQRARPPLILWS